MDKFRILKKTGTHADVFAAVGLADLLSPVVDSCVIRDSGYSFEVEVIPELTEVSAASFGTDAGYLYLQAKESEKVPEGVPAGMVLNYQAESERAARFWEAVKQARLAGSELAEAVEVDKPRADWRLYQVLNRLQGEGGTNKAFLRIVREPVEKWRKVVRQALEALQDGAVENVGLSADLVQLFNPHAAKGYARLKPDSTGRGDKTKDAWAEPFLEWLRYRGYFRVACPFSPRKTKDVRLLCPVPKNVGARMLALVVSELRQALIGGSATKIDCLSVLRLAQLLIERSAEFHVGYTEPTGLIAGVTIVHYQKMSRFAYAATAMENLALPGWFELRSPADAELWMDTLAEHFGILRRLDDNNSDELGMLQQYRRYLEQRGSEATMRLLAFLESYGVFVLRKRGQNQWRHRQFIVSHLEEILNHQPNYREILSNPGFRAIAGAVRSATVSAQSLKRNNQDYREIRYDVLPELRRKRTLPTAGPFVEAVSDFVATYNSESARRLEMNKRSGTKRVTTEELQSFVSLFESHKDATLIGAILCAYATCREVQEPDVPAVPENNATDTEEPNAEN